MKRSRGFTLIELLVVIAIIAILASILLPVFASARERARQSSCSSNEKQLGLAIIQYTQDYDEQFPEDSFWGGTQRWVQSVQPYVKSLGVFGCPDDSLALQAAPDSSGWCGVFVSYVANSYHGGWDGVGNTPYGPIGYTNAGWMDPAPVNLSKITRPAETILLAEKFGADTQGHWPGDTCSNAPTGLVITGDMGDFGQNIPDATQSPTAAYPTGQNGGVSAHHNGRANFLFTDGHVKAYYPRDTDPDPTNQPQNNMWNGTR